jgi:hypothetical protein
VRRNKQRGGIRGQYQICDWEDPANSPDPKRPKKVRRVSAIEQDSTDKETGQNKKQIDATEK